MSKAADASWPSKANCADSENSTENDSEGDSRVLEVKRIQRICESVDHDLARRAVSVVPDRELRRECVREIRGGDGEYRAKTVRAVLKAFLRWAVEQLDSEMVFESMEGDTVKAPVPVSISEEKAREYYARLKDIERALVAFGHDPHTTMLTFTGSSENANGDPRCPVDQLDDVQSSWDPYLRRELDRVMKEAGFERFERHMDYDLANSIGYVFDGETASAKFYEYVTVIEPHKTGYGHFHVGVFASHELDQEMFQPVIEKHVDVCDIASSKAHDPDSEKTISVNEVDPSVECDSDEAEDGVVTNLGSYLSEYIGSFSDGEFLERPIHELVFYASCWATGRQRVRFSVGANKMAAEGQRIRTGEPTPSATDWRLKEIVRPDGETHPPATGGGVETEAIRGASSADPPPIYD